MRRPKADPKHGVWITLGIPSGLETAQDPTGAEGNGWRERHWNH